MDSVRFNIIGDEMTNEYGLDHDYFRKKLKCVVRDSKQYTPDEMLNELSRLMMVAAHQAGHKVEMNVLHGVKK